MILGQIPGTCVFRIEQKVNASVIGEILIKFPQIMRFYSELKEKEIFFADRNLTTT